MKKKHREKNCKEPWIRWTRKRFPTKLPNQEDLKYELKAEEETDRDLSKPIPQLLCDFHDQAEQALDKASIETQLILNANKRMVAMMAKVAISNNRMSVVIAFLTAAILVFTIVLATK